MTDAPGSGPVLLLCKTDCRPWVLGGMERLVHRLTRHLVERGVAARMVVPAVGATDTLLNSRRSPGVSVEASSALRASGWLRPADMLALRRFLRRTGARVVNIHSGVSNLPLLDILAVRAAGRLRCVVSPHLIEPISSPVLAAATRVAGHLCDAMVVSTEALRGVLVSAGVPARFVHVIPTGVPAPINPPSRTAARKRLDIAAEAFAVGAVGRLVPAKGFDVLIAALARIPDADGRIRLIVAGGGPLQGALEMAAGKMLADRARFLGFVDDPTLVYAAIDVLAIPSFVEGIPLVLKEAAFHGVPCVASDLPGIRSAVVEGETGLLVPPGDIAALGTAIHQLRDDARLRERLGASARAHAATAYTESAMADRYAEVLVGTA